MIQGRDKTENDTRLRVSYHHSNTSRSTNDGLMLGHRRRRWPNIKPSLGEQFVFDSVS